MTNSEIAALVARVRMGGVWWCDGDGAIQRVRAVKTDWVEFKDEPNLKEPVALLMDGKAVALQNEAVTAFVTLQPAVSPGT